MKPLIFLLTLTAALVAETLSLDAQIAQMQEASPQERYTLMNAIKERISTMNAQQRAEAIGKLQQQLHVQRAMTPSLQQASDAMRQQMQQQHIEQPKGASGPSGTVPGTSVNPGGSGNGGMGPQSPNPMRER